MNVKIVEVSMYILANHRVSINYETCWFLGFTQGLLKDALFFGSELYYS